MRLSLNRPVRLFVDSNTDVADNLQQEFVRVKPKKEGDREAIVTCVCVCGCVCVCIHVCCVCSYICVCV